MADRYQDRSFPAHDDYDRDASRGPAKGESDPLAELARLIGQTDPFGNFGRSNQAAAADHGDSDQYASQEQVDDGVAAGPPPWMQKRMAQQTAQQDFEPAPHPVLRRAAVYPDNQPSFHETAEPDPYDHTAAGRYDDALFGEMPDEHAAHGAQSSDGSYRDESFAYHDGYEEAASDRAPRRRGGLMTVMAVLALGVVGTGAAFAYRTFVGSTHSGPPPIIKADAGPNKIVPQQAGSGDAVGKLIQDRMSAANGTEQMVSREEQPVDVKTATTSGPRVVFPPLNQNANPPTVASVTPSNMPAPIRANGVLSGDEPRKIKTLTVRGDQADIAAAVPAPSPAPAPQVQAPASVPVAARRPPPPAEAANNANAPLSLSPQTSDPRTRVASINSASQPAVSTGGYVVQVSSQRNEADARASFRALQGKFPSVLGSRAPLIKRADLGPKGVYYRAMVGPLGTPEEASQLCSSLKSAGGQCVVQRN